MSLEELKQIISKLNSIEKNVAETNSTLTELQGKADILIKDNNELKTEVNDLKVKNYQFQKSVNQLEQYSRKKNVIISRVLVTEDEEFQIS